MSKRKRIKVTEKARTVSFVQSIRERFETKKREVTDDNCVKVVKLFQKVPAAFTEKKDMMFTLLLCFLEMYFIRRSSYKPGNISKKVNTENRDWRIVDFFKSTIANGKFPGMINMFEKPITRENHQLLSGLRSVFNGFNKKGGGKNRKILISLLYSYGVSATHLSKIAGVTERWVRKSMTQVSKKEKEDFYKRFVLEKPKVMYSKREMKVVLESFQQSCPGNSYVKTGDNFRQLCGDRELFQKYVSFVMDHNKLMTETDSNYPPIETRCYNVFLKWKKQFKVRKTMQKDIDYNCVYCFENWSLEREISSLKKKAETLRQTILNLSLGI